MRYSLKILSEAAVAAKQPLDHKMFEETVLLAEISATPEDQTAFIQEVFEHVTNPELSYLNEFGEQVTWLPRLIIDIYELDENQPLVENYQEVYSRLFEMPTEATLEDVVAKFFSDYVWQWEK